LTAHISNSIISRRPAYSRLRVRLLEEGCAGATGGTVAPIVNGAKWPVTRLTASTMSSPGALWTWGMGRFRLWLGIGSSATVRSSARRCHRARRLWPFILPLVTTLAGSWRYRFERTGAVQAASEGPLNVWEGDMMRRPGIQHPITRRQFAVQLADSHQRFQFLCIGLAQVAAIQLNPDLFSLCCKMLHTACLKRLA